MSQEPATIWRARRGLRRLWCGDDGSAFAEGAVVIPVLMALVFGVYEYSYYFYQQQLMTSGIRDAARYLARTSDPTNATIQGYAKNIAVCGTIAACDAAHARVRGWTVSTVTVGVANIANSGGSTPCGSAACNGGKIISGSSYVQVVTVSTVFADPSLGLFHTLGLSPPNLRVSHRERVIGQG